MENTVSATATGFAITKALLDTISIREYNSGVKFEAGKTYDVSALETTKKVNNVEYPEFMLGGEIKISLHHLSSLYVNDEKVLVANQGTDAECIPFAVGNGLTRFKSLIEANNNEIPKQIKCISRLKQGATAKYLTGEHETARRNAYALNKMEGVLANADFPMLVLKASGVETEADAWKTFDRITLEAVTVPVAAPIPAPVIEAQPVATPAPVAPVA